MASPFNLMQELNHHFFNNNNAIRHLWRTPPEADAFYTRHNYCCLAGEANKKEGNEMSVPRPRWCPTHDQIEILESIFEAGTVTPSRKLIVEIATHLRKFGNVGEANVFYWFQNRKARAKRKAKCDLTESESCHQDKNYIKEVREGPKRRRKGSEPPSAPHDHVLIAEDRASSSSCKNSVYLIREPVFSPQNHRINVEDQYPVEPPYLELGDERKIKMYRYSPLHLNCSYLQEHYEIGYHHGEILGGEAKYYYNQVPASPNNLAGATCNISGNDPQVGDDEFQLWDDMLAVALKTP